MVQMQVQTQTQVNTLENDAQGGLCSQVHQIHPCFGHRSGNKQTNTYRRDQETDAMHMFSKIDI